MRARFRKIRRDVLCDPATTECVCRRRWKQLGLRSAVSTQLWLMCPTIDNRGAIDLRLDTGALRKPWRYISFGLDTVYVDA